MNLQLRRHCKENNHSDENTQSTKAPYEEEILFQDVIKCSITSRTKKTVTEKIWGKYFHVPKLYKIHITLTENYLLLNASHALVALGAKEYKIRHLPIRCLMQNEHHWINCPNTTCSQPNQSLCLGLQGLELKILQALSKNISNGRTKPL